MFRNWTQMDLALRLRTINCALDRLVNDPLSEVFEEIVQTVVEQAARQELGEAAMLLEVAVESNPFWLRGYLLLGTIYQHQEDIEKAICTIKDGLATCINNLRLFESQEWLDTVEWINGPAVHHRLSQNADRMRRYEYIFRHRLALLQIGSGRFDDAIKQWDEIEDEHCA